jgi:putative SOS response-associated peptidase YedK
MQQIHDRQPVILDPGTYDAWLDPATPATEVKLLLARNLDSDLQFQRVSRTVNSVTQQKSPDWPGFCRRLWTSLDRP